MQYSSTLENYFRKISQFKVLTLEQEADLCRRIKADDRKAEVTLIHANLKFVVSVAHNYQNQGIPFEDLINIGNVGLIKAVKKFDGTKNFKFISYAVWWIRQSILQAISEQSRLMKIPLNRTADLYKIRETTERLKQKYHYIPSVEQIAEVLDMDYGDVVQAMETRDRTVSLDQSPQDSKATFSETVADPSVKIEQDVLADMSRDNIDKVLNILSDREKLILRLLHGFQDGHPMTLNEIGDKMKLTRERVRQIKEQAYFKLRKNKATRDLLNGMR